MKQEKAKALMELNMCKEFDIKPNFSAIAKKYDLDRHTVKKYYEQGCVSSSKRKRKSRYDAFKETIDELLSNSECSLIAAHQYLVHNVEGFPDNYWSFHSYVKNHGYVPKNKRVPHPRYETAIGQQLQFDWKEDITIHTKDGTPITKQVFSATLGYSRYHLFIVSPGKGTYDLIRCLIDALKRLGGMPREFLTDNMSAIVSCRGTSKTKLPGIVQLERDLGAKIRLCRVRTPETKGKVESSNRFVNRISAYDGRIESDSDFDAAIMEIERDSNMKTNESTGVPPIRLFAKERELLMPLPSGVVLESYIRESYATKVDSTMLARCRGCWYSVPVSCIGKTVRSYPIDDNVIIYCRGEVVATHKIADSKFNYDEKHYKEALSYKDLGDGEIEAIAAKNLAQMGGI